MKKFVRWVFTAVGNIFNFLGNLADQLPQDPYLAITVGACFLVLAAVIIITSPIWIPIRALGYWCGYFPTFFPK